MRTEVGDWIVGPFVAILGLIGLILFGHAEDAEMTVFGVGLLAFAVLFIYGMIRRCHDRAAVANAQAKDGAHG